MTHVRLTRLEDLRLEHRPHFGHRYPLNVGLEAEIHADGAEMILKCAHAGGGHVRVNSDDEHVCSRHLLENFLKRFKEASRSVEF